MTSATASPSPQPPKHSGWKSPPSLAQQLAGGKDLRKRLPREKMGELSDYDRKPLQILTDQNETRVQDLISLRSERLGQNPFSFYRGTAAIMAADMAEDEHSDLLIPTCGDAHISNFGFYASPQQTLVFDLNDFDESAWGPWEWDLKRMLTSMVIAGQTRGLSDSVIDSAVLSAVDAYAWTLRKALALSPRERFYTHLDAEARAKGMNKGSRRVLANAIKQARKKTGERAASRLTAPDSSGRLRFIDQPPTMMHLSPELESHQYALFQRYLETVRPDIKLLMRHYEVSDIARRVVGVGSVGTRCMLSVLQDGDGSPFILQSKQAQQSVLVQYGKIKQPRELERSIEEYGEGARVVALQQILQGVSDPFLGYLRFHDSSGRELDLYVRQFHDMKGGIDAATLGAKPFERYSRACGLILARAHSQSPLAGLISGYVGSGKRLGKVLLSWGRRYAERSQADYEAFLASQSRANQ